ncbi:hypothetical protein Cme02nite_19150 [Catellatospora methionotrophica]|uniref:Uncharacterized protein n=1 Tax=Catellatospora methionotrophica TaxID=121620 RepID=A0A8J3L3B0_9ACTN|nr:hypothetical protein [Catellatospora methionotrophica]GIG13583.1 hypothetical protein Cme02nite_19150 [Catellatospora methionotrophica]
MRVVRVLVGLLALLAAVPALAAGGGAAWIAGHDSPDGAFHAKIAPPKDPNRVLVVPDLDALLQRDVPYARIGATTVRLSASSANTPAFIGVAAPDEVAAYLAGIRYTEVAQTTVGPGPVVLRTNRMDAPGREPTDPLAQGFWMRQGLGSLSWNPQLDRGQHLALVVVLRDTAAGAEPALPSDAATLDVALGASWLGTASWGLLILGMVLLILAFVTLSWPTRLREQAADATDATEDGALTALLSTGTRPVLSGTTEVVTVAAPPEQRAPQDPEPGVRPPQDPDRGVPAPLDPEPGVRPPMTVPWAGAPYTGPTASPVATREQLAAEPAARSTALLEDTVPHQAVPAVTAPAAAVRAGAAPALPWPPPRGTRPATAPVREVLTEEFVREWLPRPGCELRLDRSRQHA